jgi:hypothetical protein
VRAFKEGWFPEIAPSEVASETIYGSCAEIRDRVTETSDIVHAYPWGDPAYWRGPLVNETDTIGPEEENSGHHHFPFLFKPSRHLSAYGTQILVVVLGLLVLLGWRRCYSPRSSKKWHYTEVGDTESECC